MPAESQFILPTSPALSEAARQLESGLLAPDFSVLRQMSASGLLGKLLPDWQRLIGPKNIQHSAHAYPLDEHTFKVIEGAKAADYYAPLTPYQKRLTTLAGLLHDIAKNTGPLRLRATIPVDKLHPVKSAERSRRILSAWGYPVETIQRIYTVIHHHQALGRLFIFYKEGAPPDVLRQIAVKIRSVDVLHCLLALSEGDIRGVQEHGAIFTPALAVELAEYAERVTQDIRSFSTGTLLLPQTDGRQIEQPNTESPSAGFVLSAETADALAAFLTRQEWGGAMALPYCADLSTLPTNRSHAVIRFLPENLAFCGPLPETRRISAPAISMSLFYALLFGRPLQGGTLTAEESQWLSECLESRDAATPVLSDLAQQWNCPDWAEARTQFMHTTFDPECPIASRSDTLPQACLNQFSNHSLWGIGTRPIITAILNTSG